MEDGPAGAELAWLSVHKRYSCQGSPKLECLIWPRQYIEPEEISVMDDAIRKIIGASTTVKKQMVNDNKELAFWLAYLSLRQVEDIEKLDGVSFTTRLLINDRALPNNRFSHRLFRSRRMGLMISACADCSNTGSAEMQRLI